MDSRKARERPAYLAWRMVVSTENGPTKTWIADRRAAVVSKGVFAPLMLITSV